MLKVSLALSFLVLLSGACKTTSQGSKVKSVQFSANGRPFLLYKEGLDIKLDLCSRVPDGSNLTAAKASCSPTKTYTKKLSEFLSLMANSFNTAVIPGLAVVASDQKTLLQSDVKKLEADLAELNQSIEFLEVAYSDTADAELVSTINELKTNRAQIEVKLAALKDRIAVMDTQTDQQKKEEDLLTSLKELNQTIDGANKVQSAIISLVISQERHVTLRDDPKKDSSFRYMALEVFGIPEYYCADGYQVRDKECKIKSCGTVDGAERKFGDTWQKEVSNGTGLYRCTDLAVVDNYDVMCSNGFDRANKACVPRSCGDRPSGSTWTIDTTSSVVNASCDKGIVSSTEACKEGYSNMGGGCVPSMCNGRPHGSSWTDPYNQGTIVRSCSMGITSDGPVTCTPGWDIASQCTAKISCGKVGVTVRNAGDNWQSGSICTGIKYFACDNTGVVRETSRDVAERCKNGIPL